MNIKSAILNILHVIYVEKDRTGDFQMTKGILQIIENGGNEDDVMAFMFDRFLPVDDIESKKIAAEIMSGNHPKQGFLTISNALQWRLQYSCVIQSAGEIEGVYKIC